MNESDAACTDVPVRNWNLNQEFLVALAGAGYHVVMPRTPCGDEHCIAQYNCEPGDHFRHRARDCLQGH